MIHPVQILRTHIPRKTRRQSTLHQLEATTSRSFCVEQVSFIYSIRGWACHVKVDLGWIGGADPTPVPAHHLVEGKINTPGGEAGGGFVAVTTYSPIGFVSLACSGRRIADEKEVNQLRQIADIN